MGHESVKVRFGHMRANIDKMIAPLIKEMWKAFIETEECCQETEPGFASIWFPNEEELRRFLNIVADPADWQDKDSMYKRINSSGYKEDTWRFYVIPEDYNIAEYNKSASFHFAMMALIPHKDIPTLVDILRKHNK